MSDDSNLDRLFRERERLLARLAVEQHWGTRNYIQHQIYLTNTVINSLLDDPTFLDNSP
jgi:hypothetical protein